MSQHRSSVAAVSITALVLLLLSGTLFAQIPKLIYEEGYSGTKKLFEQAVVAGDVEICEALLGRNAFYVNEVDSNGNTQLHYAAISGQLELCKILLECGANPIIPRKFTVDHEVYYTPLEAAIISDNTEVALLLIEAAPEGAFKAVRGRNKPAIFYAIENENIEIIKALLAKGVDPNAPEMIRSFIQTPFYYACALENIDIAKILIEAGTDINKVQNKIRTGDSLFVAARTGNEELCSFLIDSKIDLGMKDDQGKTVLHILLETLKPQIFYTEPSIYTSKSTFALGETHKKIIKGHTRPSESEEDTKFDINPLFKRFVAAGADVNARDKNDASVAETMFIIQSVNPRTDEQFAELLELMLEAKLDLNAKDKNGWTVLYYYMFYSLNDRSEFKPNLKEEEIKAIAEKKMAMFKKLVEAGADVKIADEKGNTLLHYAIRAPFTKAQKGNLNLDLNYDTRGKHEPYTRLLLEYLIEKGIPFSVENKEGKTPLSWSWEAPPIATPNPGSSPMRSSVDRSAIPAAAPSMRAPSSPSEAADMLLRQ